MMQTSGSRWPLEFSILSPQLAQLGRSVGGHAGALPRIGLRLSDPVMERLSPTYPELACDGLDCCLPRAVFVADLGDHPHCPITQLRRVPL
ncbi:hypothetical protein ACQR3V_06935 [Rhodococcus erythropolis]|uniref:hypothetical protein n=1 Tax=Rhodococcus erythropolis TaxID=1833 RepID=UPI003D0EC604